MSDYARDLLKAESTFLSGVGRNFERAKGRQLKGSIWRTSRQDESDHLREVMARHQVYDRERLKELPHNRRIAVHGFRRTWWLGKRKTGVAGASVLCPLDQIVAPEGDGPQPIDLARLTDHVRRVASDRSVPYVLGVCAPTGFTEEARRAKVDLPNVTLVLVEPDQSGGWRVTDPDGSLPADVRALFDPEADKDKLDRVVQEIESRSADLIVGGISLESVAERLALPEPLVNAAMQRAADKDPELRISSSADGVFLYRGVATPGAERKSMNVVDRIRQLFSREGDEAEKINLLSERRATLAQRRDRLYEDIGKLEKKEGALLEQGRQTQSSVTRRRLAAQLAQARKDIGRENTAANMLNHQINILSTDIHNLTLIQQGEMAKLPDTEELTENAVKAEEMLESLKVDAEMVGELETGLTELATTDEELSILKEFEQSEEPEAAPPAPEQPRTVDPEPPSSHAAPEATEPPAEPPSRSADPEAT